MNGPEVHVSKCFIIKLSNRDVFTNYKYYIFRQNFDEVKYRMDDPSCTVIVYAALPTLFRQMFWFFLASGLSDT